MYLLEDRILFDGAAAVDVATLIKEQQDQQEQQQEDAQNDTQNSDAQNQTAETSSSDSSGDNSADSTTASTDYTGSIDALIQDALNSQQQDVHVLIVSETLQNAHELVDSASADTIVISYDPAKVSLDSLLESIKSSLGDKKADSIAFAVQSNDASQLIISSSDVTSAESIANDAEQQEFWSELGTLMDSDGRIDILSSDFAGTAKGDSVIDAIENLTHADVAASTDLTGGSADADWILEDGNIDVVDVYFDGEKIDAYDYDITVKEYRQLAIINSELKDSEDIASQLGNNVDVLYVDGYDAMSEIETYLDGKDGFYDSIHMFVHGGNGYFYLGNTRVDGSTVDSLSAQIAAWGDSLNEGGDILIYGCDLAKDDAGQSFVDNLAGIAHADIAASSDITGRAGNWVLEYHSGSIAAGAFTIDYAYNLKDITVTTILDDDGGLAEKTTLREAIAELNALEGGGTITFASADTLGGTTIRLKTGANYNELVITNDISINGEISLGNGAFTYVGITREDASAPVNGLESAQAHINYADGNNDYYVDQIQDKIDDTPNKDATEIDDPTPQSWVMYYFNRSIGEVGETDYSGQLVASITNAYNEANNLVTYLQTKYDAMVDGADKVAALVQLNIAINCRNAISDCNDSSIINGLIFTAYDQMTTYDGDTINQYMSISGQQNANVVTCNTQIDALKDAANELCRLADNQGGASFRLLRVDSGATVVIKNTSFFFGKVDENVEYGKGQGGAIYNLGSLTLTNINIHDNTATNDGGGIYNAGTLNIYLRPGEYSGVAYCTINNNTAANSGGGIFNSTGTVTIEGNDVNRPVYISNNTATNGSGGGYYTETAINLTFVTISGNEAAAGAGGGGYIKDAAGDSYFYSVDYNTNKAATDGGGLYTDNMSGKLTMRYSWIQDNEATNGNGGGIYMKDSGNLIIVGQYTDGVAYSYGDCWDCSIVTGNTAGNSGGGIYMDNSGNFTADFLRLGDNTAETGNGGGLYMVDSGTATFYDSEIYHNIATSGLGGGIYYAAATPSAGLISITTSSFYNNNKYSNTVFRGTGGGAIYMVAGKLTAVNSTFAYNYTNTGNGGAIYIGSSPTLNLTFCTLAYNEAINGKGSAFYLDAASTSTILNTIIHENEGNSEYYFTDGAASSISGTYNVVLRHNSLWGYNFDDDSNKVVGDLGLDTELMYHANYKTMALAITNESSVAFAGLKISSISYDQRGNYRYTVANNTVVQYGRDNKSLVAIGAFDPIFKLTVNTKADDTSVFSADQASLYSNSAIYNYVTLREAVYWIDNYEGSDSDRYINFDTSVFKQTSGNDNTIYLQGSGGGAQIVIGSYRRVNSDKQIIIDGSLFSERSEIDNNYNYDHDTRSLQTDSWRITIDARSSEDATANSRIFGISSGVVTINDITVQNGVASTAYTGFSSGGCGGGMYIIGGTVTLNNILIQNCTAAHAGGSYSSGYGGGIYLSWDIGDIRANLSMSDTTITGCASGAEADGQASHNSGYGGGMYVTYGADLFMQRCTVDNNTATNNSTYYTDSALGGGICFRNSWGNIYIYNSTIAHNTVYSVAEGSGTALGAGIYADVWNLNIVQSTIAYNLANLKDGSDETNHSALYVADTYNSAVLNKLQNSIVANNQTLVRGNAGRYTYNDIYALEDNVSATAANASYNIIGRYFTGVDNFDWGDASLHNHVSTNIDPASAMYGKIDDLYLCETLYYRGGLTRSLKLLEGSWALSNYGATLGGNASSDQRGADRYVGMYVIGSYQPIHNVVVDRAGDSNSVPTDVYHSFTTNTPWLSDNNLREGVMWADPDSTITIMENLETWQKVGNSYAYVPVLGLSTITLTSTLTIDKSVEIVTQNNHEVIIQASENSPSVSAYTFSVLTLALGEVTGNPITVTLNNLVIRHGSAQYGGGIYSQGNLILNNTQITDNCAQYGGGIYSVGRDLTINSGSSVYGNEASEKGGGIYFQASKNFSISYAEIYDNTARVGGGMYVIGAGGAGAECIIEYSAVYSNTASDQGGGIMVSAADLTVVNSTVSQNTSGNNGGGINFGGGGTLSLIYVTVANNSNTGGSGAGLYQSAGVLQMANTVIAQNTGTDVFLYAFDGSRVHAVYSVLGTVNSESYFPTAAAKSVYISTRDNFTVAELFLDTAVSDNGGPTKSLYVGGGTTPSFLYQKGTQVALGDDGEYYYQTVTGGVWYKLADSTLKDGAVTETPIQYDQRGSHRHDGVAADNGTTIGSYEKMTIAEATHYYIGGINDNVNDASKWTNSASVGDFIVPDSIFVFDTHYGTLDAVTIEAIWTVGSKCTVEIHNGYEVTVGTTSFTVSIANLTVDSGGSFTVNGLFVGEVTLAGDLVLATTNLSGITIASATDTSTVTYSAIAGTTQELLIVADASGYGNLTLNGGTKTSSESTLYVRGNLTVGSVFNANNISVNGLINVTASGNLSGDEVYSLGSVTITDGTFTASGAVTVGTSMMNADLTIDGGTYSSAATRVYGNVSLSNGTGMTVTDFKADGLDVNNSQLNAGTGDITIYNNGAIIMASGGSISGWNIAAADLSVDGSTVTASNNLTIANQIYIDNATLTATNNISGTGITSTGSNESVLTAKTISITNFDVQDTSTLTISVSTDFTIYDHDGGTYNSDNMTVASNARIKFVTTQAADVVIQDGAAGIQGIFYVEAYALSVDITLSAGGLGLSSTGLPLEISTIHVERSIEIGGNVKLVDANALIQSNTGHVYVETTNLDGDGNNLTVSAVNGDVRLKNLNDLGNLNVISNSAVQLYGTIVASGDITFNQNTVIAGSNVSVTGRNLNIKDISGTGTQNLTLNNSVGNNIDNITGLQNLTLAGAGSFGLTLVGITGSLTNSAATTIGTLTLAGATNQVISNTGSLTVTALNYNSTGGIEFRRGSVYVTNFNWISNLNVTISNGNLYLENAPAIPGDRWFVTSGSGMLYQQMVGAGNTVYRIGSANGGLDLTLTSGIGANGWVGLRASDGIAANNPYNPSADIRSLDKTVKLTFTLDNLSGTALMADVDSTTATGSIIGGNFNPLAYSMYRYTGGSWTINSTSIVSSGQFMFGNTTGMDFRAAGVLDFPTEGWTLYNSDNMVDWRGEDMPMGPYHPTIFAPSSLDLGGFGVSVDTQRGFSLIGLSGDLGGSLDQLPVGGERGINPYASRFQLLGDANFDSLSSGFGLPYEEEMDFMETDGELEDYLDFEGINAVSATNELFKSDYDAAMENFLAC